MKRAIILAAGKGERLVNGFDFPKPLKRVAGEPLIVRVLRSLERADVTDVAIVIGHLGEVLAGGLRRHRFEMDVRFVWNQEYEKPNGTSLLKARRYVDGPTYLLMSDHLWSPDLIQAVGSYPLADDEAVLGVDFDVPGCFDLEDATKVQLEDDRIVGIGKTLDHYDALDTGVFRITPALIDELARLDGESGCSLSQGVAALARTGRMRAVDVGDAAWIDVDTPAAHAEAERLIALHGEELRAVSVPAAAGL
jgi:choline kinase